MWIIPDGTCVVVLTATSSVCLTKRNSLLLASSNKKAVAAAAAFVVAFARDQNAIELLVRMRRGRRDAFLDTDERFRNSCVIWCALLPLIDRRAMSVDGVEDFQVFSQVSFLKVVGPKGPVLTTCLDQRQISPTILGLKWSSHANLWRSRTNISISPVLCACRSHL